MTNKLENACFLIEGVLSFLSGSPHLSSGNRRTGSQSIWFWKQVNLNYRSTMGLGEIKTSFLQFIDQRHINTSFITQTLLTGGVSIFIYITNHWPQVLVATKIPQSIMCLKKYTKSHLHCNQGKSNNLIGAWARPTCWSWRVSWRMGSNYSSPWGHRHWCQTYREHSATWTLPMQCILDYFCQHLAPPIEKAMAPHSSALAWRIPWTEEPGSLQSMGLLWVRHNWETSLSLFTFMHWRRKWQPTPVFLPGEFPGTG